MAHLEHFTYTNTTLDGNDSPIESRLWKSGHIIPHILPARIRDLNPFKAGSVYGADEISSLETAEGTIFSGTISEITDILQRNTT